MVTGWLAGWLGADYLYHSFTDAVLLSHTELSSDARALWLTCLNCHSGILSLTGSFISTDFFFFGELLLVRKHIIVKASTLEMRSCVGWGLWRAAAEGGCWSWKKWYRSVCWIKWEGLYLTLSLSLPLSLPPSLCLYLFDSHTSPVWYPSAVFCSSADSLVSFAFP